MVEFQVKRTLAAIRKNLGENSSDENISTKISAGRGGEVELPSYVCDSWGQTTNI